MCIMFDSKEMSVAICGQMLVLSVGATERPLSIVRGLSASRISLDVLSELVALGSFSLRAGSGSLDVTSSVTLSDFTETSETFLGERWDADSHFEVSKASELGCSCVFSLPVRHSICSSKVG